MSRWSIANLSYLNHAVADGTIEDLCIWSPQTGLEGQQGFLILAARRGEVPHDARNSTGEPHSPHVRLCQVGVSGPSFSHRAR